METEFEIVDELIPSLYEDLEVVENDYENDDEQIIISSSDEEIPPRMSSEIKIRLQTLVDEKHDEFKTSIDEEERKIFKILADVKKERIEAIQTRYETFKTELSVKLGLGF
jgi:hypothetical protein